MSAKITDRDKGFRALFKRLNAPPRSLSVGILEEAEGTAHGKTTIGEIATIHEFGIGQHERSFIRAWADARETENLATLRKIGQAVLKGTYDAAIGLARAGALFAGQIKARIASGIPPANAQSTIDKKGSSTPLIDTGVLVSSITWKVE